MSYSIIDKPTDYFNTKLYTGNGGTQSITGVGFQPDWVWIKNRTSAEASGVFDVVRGVTKMLATQNTDAETTDTNSLTAFGSDGFSVGSNLRVNQNSNNIVSWNWLGANGTASNSDGSITSTVSANTTAGFSIVSYTGNGNNNDTAKVGHGLGVAPNMIMVKCRNNAGGWQTSSTSLGWNNVLQLNETNAQASGTYAFGQSGVTPTSTVFTVSATSGGNHTNTNNNTYIAYCFAEKKGYSKFGSYTGNGNADGTFIYTGFKPAFVMVKKSSASGSDWNLHHNKSPGFNVNDNYLAPNSNASEVTNNSFQIFDLLSNGFKCRGTGTGTNASGETMIYMAFAESPFVGSNFVPNNAR